MTTFPNEAAEFTYVRTYSRWLPELGRRETWLETVDRYMQFLMEAHGDKIPEGVWRNLEEQILYFNVMGSMRAMWAAGPAAAAEPMSIYNCAAVIVDCPMAFGEILYGLMCGTGIGFRVLDSDVEKLPDVPKWILPGFPEEGLYAVEDSKAGWAQSVVDLIEALYRGEDFLFDYSKIRPRGARLKTMGGRASGPEPLIRLHEFIRKTFDNAWGRKLTPLECHDICTMIGEIVVVGGVRRSALISLSDVSNEEMRHCKTGDWPFHRAMANNSAVYFEKPSREVFDAEWKALAESGTGERGFFNLGGARANAPARRDASRLEVTNPCVTADTWVMTADGPRQVCDLIGRRFAAVVDGKNFESDGFFPTGVHDVFDVVLKNGVTFRATKEHKVLVATTQDRYRQIREWKTVGDLIDGDLVVLHDHADVNWAGRGTAAEGWMLGSLLGDGNIEKSGKANLDFWGATQDETAAYAIASVHATVGGRSDLAGYKTKTGLTRIGSMRLGELAASFGMTNTSKSVTPAIEMGSSEFCSGFLRGWFDADGTVIGSQQKGVSVRLASIDLSSLQAAQRMLGRLGVVSKIYETRKEPGVRPLPDGRGGYKDYHCQAIHELVISGSNLERFYVRVGFGDSLKAEKLDALFDLYVRKLNLERFTSAVQSVTLSGTEQVYDCTVPGPAAFDGNGVYLHNCSEIVLRNGQLCNLSEVIIRADDTPESVSNKVFAATWLGALQSTFTDFKFVRPQWKENCEAERLLGVSLTGQFDAPHLFTPANLKLWRSVAIETAAHAAEVLGIPMPAAITTVKPSGSVSILCDSASGQHPRYAKYYIRRFRISASDPLFKMMASQGVRFYPEVGQRPEDNPHEEFDPLRVTTWVCEFPVAAPEGSITRHDVSAIEQLEHTQMLSRHWCEHSASLTVYVGDDEWDKVGDWVYEHWDSINGVSFLPKMDADHKYDLAPYEEISKEEYERMMADRVEIDYSQLSFFELEDETEGAKTYACVGDKCELS